MNQPQKSVVQKIKSNQPSYYPFLTRFDLNLLKEGSDVIGQSCQAFKLHSLAKTDSEVFDIYALFFPDLQYKAASQKFLTIQVPNFINELVKIICLRSILFHHGLTKSMSQQRVQRIVHKLKGQPTQEQKNSMIQSSYAEMQREIHIEGLNIFSDNRINLSFKAMEAIYYHLLKKKNEFLRKFDDWDEKNKKCFYFDNIANMAPQHQKLVIASTLQKIYRVPAFQPQHRQKIISNFVQKYKNYAHFVYSTKNPNFIIQLKKEKEKQPVLLGLVHYLKNTHNLELQIKRTFKEQIQKSKLQSEVQAVSKPKQQIALKQKIPSQKQIKIKKLLQEKKLYIQKQRKQLIEDLIAELLECATKSKLPYPSLNIQSIIFNQKSLKPHLSFTHLIIHGLGLENTGSLELKLCTSPTPKSLQYEQGYLEREKSNQWWLNLKFYDINCQSEEDMHLQQQIKKKRQRMYVWRAICVMYYIMNQSKHLTWAKYRQKYGKKILQSRQKPLSVQQDDYVVFQAEKYEALCSQIYQYFQKNPQGIVQQLKMEGLKDYSNVRFGFTLVELAQLLNLPFQVENKIEDKRYQSTQEGLLNTKAELLSKLLQFLKSSDQLNLSKARKNLINLFKQSLKMLLEIKVQTGGVRLKQQMYKKIEKLNQSTKNLEQFQQLFSLETEIKKKLLKSINHKIPIIFENQAGISLEQEKSMCFEALQSLIQGQAEIKQEINPNGTQNPKNYQQKIFTDKLALLLKTLKTLSDENMLKYKNFIIPFIIRDHKKHMSQEQFQEYVIRHSLALQIVSQFELKAKNVENN